MSETITNAPRLGSIEVGQLITVVLPDERTRAEVTEVIDQDHIKAKLIITPIAKSHMFKLNQIYSFHRAVNHMGDKWEIDS